MSAVPPHQKIPQPSFPGLLIFDMRDLYQELSPKCQLYNKMKENVMHIAKKLKLFLRHFLILVLAHPPSEVKISRICLFFLQNLTCAYTVTGILERFRNSSTNFSNQLLSGPDFLDLQSPKSYERLCNPPKFTCNLVQVFIFFFIIEGII